MLVLSNPYCLYCGNLLVHSFVPFHCKNGQTISVPNNWKPQPICCAEKKLEQRYAVLLLLLKISTNKFKNLKFPSIWTSDLLVWTICNIHFELCYF